MSTSCFWVAYPPKITHPHPRSHTLAHARTAHLLRSGWNSLDEGLITVAMCLCLHLKFKFQAGSAVVIKRAAAAFLSPGAEHTRAQEDQPLRTLYTRENMGNTQSNMSTSFGSRNLLLSNKETKLPSNAEGKACSLFWVLMRPVWFICNKRSDSLHKKIILTLGRKEQSFNENEIALFFSTLT